MQNAAQTAKLNRKTTYIESNYIQRSSTEIRNYLKQKNKFQMEILIELCGNDKIAQYHIDNEIYYDANEGQNNISVVAICGMSGSGKTTLTRNLAKYLKCNDIADTIRVDQFFKLNQCPFLDDAECRYSKRNTA